jgi:hypothetical protein
MLPTWLRETPYATVEGAALANARAAPQKWIDGMTGVVISPALGRVTVIHGNGRKSAITSASLPFLMSTPVAGKREG